MNRNLSLYLAVFIFLLGLSSCDEGKIYPDDAIDTGRTATITLHFTEMDAWPEKNYLVLMGLGEDETTPLLTKRILQPGSEEEAVTITLNNLSEDTRTIAIAVATTGMSLVYSYQTFSVDNAAEKTITLPETTVGLASYKRIQSQIFNQKCVACHGGSTSEAGQLNLMPEKSYAGMVNIKAPHSESGKNYVTPGDISNSHLLDALEQDNHSDIFNGAERREVLALIRTWIKVGAENN